MNTRDGHEVEIYNWGVVDASPFCIHGTCHVGDRWFPFAWTRLGRFQLDTEEHPLDLMIPTHTAPVPPPVSQDLELQFGASEGAGGFWGQEEGP